MATITSPTGSILPQTRFFDVDVDNVVTSNASTYSWTTQQGGFLGNVVSQITLVGSFSYPGGVPAGQVAQILIDSDGDGDTDLTIAFSSFQSILADLISGNANNFWSAAFSQNNTLNLAGTAGSTGFTFGGYNPSEPAFHSADTATITGSGRFIADADFVRGGFIGGDDNIILNSTDVDASTTIYGDGNLSYSDDIATGGDDTLVDQTASSTSTSKRVTFYGDFFSSPMETINGGDDTITATNRAATIYGDTGSLYGDATTFNAGDDILTGGSLNDVIVGDFTFISVSGVTVNGGGDTINGGGGDDQIYGEHTYSPSGANGAIVTGGDDIIDGEAGDDIIYGQFGNDVINGGADNDTIFGGSGNDTIDGDGGIDTANFSKSLFGVTVVLGNVVDGSATGNGTDILREIENIVGTSVNDTITGNNSDNTFEGGGGNDTMNGSGGNNTASYAGASSGVTVDLSLTAQQATLGAGDDTLSNFDNLIGSDHDDTLFGSDGTNKIYGGGGNDILLLRSGTSSFPQPGNNNEFYGEAGDDTIGFSLAGIGQSNVGLGHVLDGGSDGETLGDAFTFDLYSQGYSVILDSNGSGDFARISTGVVIASLVDFENIIAGNGDDFLQHAGYGTKTITANGGNDLIDVTGGANTLDAGDGNDVILGGNSVDMIIGAADNDWMFDGLGNDTIAGGAGVDFFAFNAANNNSGDIVSDYSAEDFIYLGNTTAPASITVSGGDVIVDGATFTGAASDNVSVVTQNSTMGFDAANNAALQNVLANGVGGLTAFGAFTHTIFDANNDEAFNKDISVYTTDGLDYRVVQNDDGSSLQINFDQTNGNGWSEIATTRDTANMITNEVTTLDTGAFFSKFFDVDGTQPWLTSTTGKTATNATDYQDITYDDNTRIFTDYDQEGTIPWTTALTNYNAAGQQVFRRVNFDDGRFEVTYEDFDSSQDWNTKIDTYTDGVNRDFVNFYNDDGTRKTVDFDQDTSQLWSTKEIFYNAGGAATSFIEYNDDGTRRSKVFDPDDAANWNEILIVYDAAGAQDFRRDDYDLGENGLISYLVREFDNENTEVWDTRFREYDVDDNLLNEYFT